MSAVFREMTCLRTNTAMFCSTAAPSIPAQFLFNPFLPSLTLTHCNRELTPSTMLSHCSASYKPRQIRAAFSRAHTLTPRLIWLLKHVMALNKHGAGKAQGYMGQRKMRGKSPFTIPLDLLRCATQFAHLSVYQRWIKSANSLTQHIIKTSCSRSGIF